MGGIATRDQMDMISDRQNIHRIDRTQKDFRVQSRSSRNRGASGSPNAG